MSLRRFCVITIFAFVVFSVAKTTNGATIARPMHNSGLISYWNFEEGSGNKMVYDRSGRGYNGTLTNINTATSWINSSTTGTAINLDGTDDFISTGTNLSPYTSVTFSWWMNISNFSFGDWRDIFATPAVPDDGDNGIEIFIDHNGAGSCDVSAPFGIVNTGGAGNNFACYTPPSAGVWHHYTVTLDRSINGPREVNLYIDGIIQVPNSIPDTTNTTGNNFALYIL